MNDINETNDTTPIRISALEDLMFKKLLSNEEKPQILAGLIHDFFGIEAKNIRIKNPYNIKLYAQKLEEVGGDYGTLRSTITDIKAVMDAGGFTAECQVKKHEWFLERSMKYTFDYYSDNYAQVESVLDINPDKYSSLIPVYALNILGYPQFKDAHALRDLTLFDRVRKIGMDKDLIHIGYFELQKELEEKESNLRYWRDLFLGNNLPEDAPVYIRDASEILQYNSLAREEREMIDLEEKYKDKIAGERAAERAAVYKEAYFGGREEERKEIARNMKADGDSPDKITRNTGLSYEQVMAL